MSYPAEYRYTKDHEWFQIEGTRAKVGITHHAQEELGDIVFVELPSVGAAVTKGQNIATVESVKAVGDVASPLGGKVVEVNDSLEASPETVNQSPHDDGWLFVIELSRPKRFRRVPRRQRVRAIPRGRVGMRYIPNTDADRRAMLDTIGFSSLDDLFRDIPEAVRSSFVPLGLRGRSEQEVAARLSELASQDAASSKVPLLGGGIYDHYTPSIVDHMASRTEFYTAYTPYQPEISQGTLTVMFEFQTLIAELTGMEIANASMYDGATSLAEAILMATRIRRVARVAVARNLFPTYRRVIDTYAWAAGIELLEIPYGKDGRSDLAALPKHVAAVVLQSPNAFGVIESLDGTKESAGGRVARRRDLSDIARTPRAARCIRCGHRGWRGAITRSPDGVRGTAAWAVRDPATRIFVRCLDGSPDEPSDAAGAVGYTMAAQTREQHIRREKATSNICTNSALCALAATVYLASVGADGLEKVARLNHDKAHYLAGRIAELDGYDLIFDAPFFNEFVVRVPGDVASVRARLDDAGFLVDGSNDLERLGVKNALRFAVTEKRTRVELDRLVEVLGGAR